MRNSLLIAALIALSAGILVAQSGRVVNSNAQSCGYRAWVNAFHPQEPVMPKASDRCPVDLTKLTFTREGSLACPDRARYLQASNAMRKGWHYESTAGIADKKGARNGMPVTPEYFGCTIYHDGTAVKATRADAWDAFTDMGWMKRANMRN